jgi:integrase
MSEVTTRRSRKDRAPLTDRMCEKRVAKQTKIYDPKCPGLYVSVSPSGVATFNFKKGKRSKALGLYCPAFRVAAARAEVYALRGRIGKGESVFDTMRKQKEQAAGLSVLVNQVIDERIEWMEAKVLKRDGEMRPRIESWKSVASHLRRFVSPRLGNMVASEVTNRDIARLSDDIVAGQFGKPSTANARHMRRAASAMFTWAAAPSRGYVTASPCIHLEKLDEEHPRDRVLNEDEIRTLWHGLDRDDLPYDRSTKLALKFALVTMLRSGEMLPIHRDELNPENGSVDIKASRVKKRRVINQPLSDLAWGIITEVMGNYDYAFTGRFGDAPLARNAMANALRGTKRLVNGVKVTRTPGICELLGLAPFAPHDLRRTAATMCGELGLSEGDIALCLDHQASKDENGKPLPATTNRVYNLGTRARVERKRAILDAWAIELRRIIGEPAIERLAA